jgi:hypothetical protein
MISLGIAMAVFFGSLEINFYVGEDRRSIFVCEFFLALAVFLISYGVTGR